MAKILLAEDDSSMREYLQRALQRVGYHVEAVGCGTEAVPLLEREQFDLLLTDIVMPEMDGIELAQKASSIDPNIRVMFITGFAAVALQGGRTTPGAKLLSKPFHLKDLVAEVDRIFQTEDQHGRLYAAGSPSFSVIHVALAAATSPPSASWSALPTWCFRPCVSIGQPVTTSGSPARTLRCSTADIRPSNAMPALASAAK